MSIRIKYRLRVLGRLEDPDGKWRDEMTQELEIESSEQFIDLDSAIESMKAPSAEIRRQLFNNLHKAGGKLYDHNALIETMENVNPKSDIEKITNRNIEDVVDSPEGLKIVTKTVSASPDNCPAKKIGEECFLDQHPIKAIKALDLCFGCPTYDEWLDKAGPKEGYPDE